MVGLITSIIILLNGRVEKFQSNEYGWLDYVNHHSPEWQEEFTAFCKERNLTINEESAEQFVEWKGDQLENAQDN